MPRYGKTIDMGNGSWMHVCYTAPPPKPCYICGRPSIALCDWPDLSHKSGTCDRPLCAQHRVKPVPTFGKPETADIDYCLEHGAIYQKERDLKEKTERVDKR